jgi:hypothetical protein
MPSCARQLGKLEKEQQLPLGSSCLKPVCLKLCFTVQRDDYYRYLEVNPDKSFGRYFTHFPNFSYCFFAGIALL